MSEASGGDAPRKRGRPPGSKNKASAGRRGRPGKAADKPKRGRGRPPKHSYEPPPSDELRAAQSACTALVEIITPKGERFYQGATAEAEAEIPDEELNGPWPRMRGRKPIMRLSETLLEAIFQKGLLRLTMHEAAAEFRVSHSTFQRFLRDNPLALEAWQDGRNCLGGQLKRIKIGRALAGDPAMLALVSKDLGPDGALEPADRDGITDKAAADEVENQGGQIKRIVFEFVDPQD